MLELKGKAEKECVPRSSLLEGEVYYFQIYKRDASPIFNLFLLVINLTWYFIIRFYPINMGVGPKLHVTEIKGRVSEPCERVLCARV